VASAWTAAWRRGSLRPWQRMVDAMREITERGATALDHHGVVHLPGLLDDEWLKRLEAAFMDATSVTNPTRASMLACQSTMPPGHLACGLTTPWEPPSVVINVATLYREFGSIERPANPFELMARIRRAHRRKRRRAHGGARASGPQSSRPALACST